MAWRSEANKKAAKCRKNKLAHISILNFKRSPYLVCDDFVLYLVELYSGYLLYIDPEIDLARATFRSSTLNSNPRISTSRNNTRSQT